MEIAEVVVAVDGSPSSLLAVDWAADEAFRRGLGLRLVHASVRERYEQGVEDDGDPDSERKLVQEMLFAAAERAEVRRPGLELATEVLAAEPVTALLELLGPAPLLVLGSRGRGGFHGLLLGSVSLRVAAHATCPVIVVRAVGEQSDRPRRRVVLALGPHEAVAATEFAVGEAVLRQADLHVVHATAGHPAGAAALMDTVVEHAMELLDAATERQTGTFRVQVVRRSAPRPPTGLLLHEAASAELVVVGAHRHPGHLGLQLGPVNHAMLLYAPCPVAVVAGTPLPDESGPAV
ncbi:universal stress protein [Streptacidiphilus sp. PAMC 29251]